MNTARLMLTISSINSRRCGMIEVHRAHIAIRGKPPYPHLSLAPFRGKPPYPHLSLTPFRGNPPYPHLSLAEAPGFASAKLGVAQAPLQIQQTQSPPHRGKPPYPHLSLAPFRGNPPYLHLSLTEAPCFASAKLGVAQAPLQIQQTQSPEHRGKPPYPHLSLAPFRGNPPYPHLSLASFRGNPPYPHLSLAEAPGFASAKLGVAQAPLQIQQTQSPPHWGATAPLPPLIVGRGSGLCVC